MNIRILQAGMGPLGLKIIGFIRERPNMILTAAADISPDLTGKDPGELAGGDPTGIRIVRSIREAVRAGKPDVAILTTVSDLERLTPQIEELCSFGIPVVSTCEELSHPWRTRPDLARRIDDVARTAGVAVLGTGVNPGFLMDTLPLTLTAVCQRVDSVLVRRIQDASARRIPFQKKIGAGLSLEEFEEKRKAGTLRHVGLTESLNMIAWHLGWTLERTEETLVPVIATRPITAGHATIEPGRAAGVEQIGLGFVNGEAKIRLEFRASVGEPHPEDTVVIRGNPDITSSVPGGINGDTATCGITLNAVRSILLAPPGLRTMADVPLVSYFVHHPFTDRT